MSVVKKAILFITLMGVALIVWICTKKEPVEGQCELKFKAVSKHDDMLVSLATQYLISTTDKPIELKDLPKGLTADYVYFLAEAAGKGTPMVLGSYSQLDRSKLYVDTNGDGRLSDEKPYRVKVKELPRPRGKEYIFGPILMKSRDEKGEFETKFYAMTGHGRQLVLYPSGYLAGKVRLGKNTYKAAVVDGNLDGRYDKIFSLPVEEMYRPGCDILGIDLSNDGKKWRLSLTEPSEIMPLGRMVRVRNTYYGIDLAPDGTTLELERIQPELGTLDFGGANVKLKLWSDTGDHYLFGSKGHWQIPAGAYSTLYIELDEIDSEQNVWTFSNRPDGGPLRDFEIRVGQTTSFKIGPPFFVKIDVRQNRGRVNIGMELKGCAGERHNVAMLKNGKPQPAPTFKVVNVAGKVLTSGQLKYG